MFEINLSTNYSTPIIKTQVVKFPDGREEEIDFLEIKISELFEALKSGKHINLERRFIPKFSFNSYRMEHHEDFSKPIRINSFNAELCLFEGDVDLSGVEITELNISKSIFENNLIINNLMVSSTFKARGLIVKGSLIIQSSTFQHLVDFTDATLNLVMFKKNRYKEIVLANNILVSNYFLIEDCRFIKKIELQRSVILSMFDLKTTKFLSHVSFSGTQFHKLFVSINNIFIQEVQISFTTFKDDVTFLKCIFKEHSNFDNSIIEGDIDFWDNAILKGLKFIGCQCSGHASWNYSEDCAYRSLILNLEYSNFQSTIRMENIQLKQIKLQGVYFEKPAFISNCVVNNADRITFRILKHECIRTNNSIDALEFYKQEMKQFGNDLKAQISNRKIKEKNNYMQSELSTYRKLFNFFWQDMKSINIYFDRVLLFLYRIVNNYGTSSLRGTAVLSCYVCISLIIYFEFGLSKDYYEWSFRGWESYFEVLGKTTKYTLDYLNPAHKISSINDGNINMLGQIIDSVSRLVLPIMYFFVLQPLKKFKN